MSEATIIAITILLGVFILMGVTLYKFGIDAALKLWAGMGALTGMAFGAITSYYFTKASTDQQIAALQSDIESKKVLLASYEKYTGGGAGLFHSVEGGLWRNHGLNCDSSCFLNRSLTDGDNHENKLGEVTTPFGEKLNNNSDGTNAPRGGA